jgi:hypothetical protein
MGGIYYEVFIMFKDLQVLTDDEKAHIKAIKDNDRALTEYLKEIHFQERLSEAIYKKKDKWYMKLMSKLIGDKKKPT